MRIKNFTLLFLMGIFGLFTTKLFAQQDATIDPGNVRYWIGEGVNEAVFIVNWAEPDTALAWGYRFNQETITLKDVMDGIAAVDNRFGYQGTSYVTDITFNDGVLDLKLSGMYWMSIKNGDMCMNYFDAEPVVNGDYVKWGDESCGTLLDPVNYVYVWEKPVAPVYPLANEAMIDPSEILYWVGEGENEVVFAVNFADPQVVCYAWGYRFAAESVTIKDMMEAIAQADGRFSFNANEYGYLSDITLDYEGNHFVLQGFNAMYNLNGMVSWNTFDEQTIIKGDFVKWGDYTIGTEIAPWTYVWETPVLPVTAYNQVAEHNSTMSLYPNPATSFTMLDMSEMSEATVTVTDLQGRVLRSFAVANTSEPVRVETEGFQAGLYFVTVSDGATHQTLKLSVK